MYPVDPIQTVNMNDQQRSWFYAEYEQARKDGTIGVLLAIFLGGLGVHHFYLHRNGTGLLYLLFSWTGIPMIVGWIEAFFMPGRVRAYNAMQAAYISNQILTFSGNSALRCSACGRSVEPTALFCNHCGATITPRALATQPAA